ncbi:heavy metal translocating P-type ATPase [uncultured Psychrosphaera sp.]|uniref:heavy metal translocating P-type ATPase n=1 Tax=uncultured Psychrosphaera sp. TaxID=1403522 RepID=UPI0030F7507D
MAETASCYHCGNDLPKNQSPIAADINGQTFQVCCLGCKSVTEHIYNNGLGTYYQFRSDMASKPEENVTDERFLVYDDIGFLEQISSVTEDPNVRKVILSVDNIHCAACAWLIEQSLTTLNGIIKVNVNTINQRAEIIWQHPTLPLSSILSKLTAVGYPSSPFNVSDTEHKLKFQEKQYIKRLGVAGLFTMQVMMIAFAMYFGAFNNMESHQVGYFKWLSLILSVPVVFYSALPFLFGSYYSIKAKKLNMDVPVAFAIYGAFFASFYQLLVNGLNGDQGEVFFESISMFTFLLLIGKYLEFRAKSKAILSNANLNKNLPVTVNKIVNGEPMVELVKNIKLGDLVLIKPGQNIAIDGVIQDGVTSVNESVLNGEFEPIAKLTGDTVLAGSINNDGVITVEVTAMGDKTTLSKIGDLQEEFARHKPVYTQFADKIAHWFVFSQLILALITYVIWYFVEPVDALWVSLSVLVATCPCALSLATPTAYTCVISALNKQGILIKDPLAFDKLSHLTHVCFDKTGTLTKGRFEIQQAYYHQANLLSLGLPVDLLKAIIIRLQKHSEHPISNAFDQTLFEQSPVELELEQGTQPEAQLQIDSLTNISAVVGSGIKGEYLGQTVKVGSAQFCGVGTSMHLSNANVFVCYQGQILAEFYVSDQLKSESIDVLSQLNNAGYQLTMLTGDSSEQAKLLGKQLKLDRVETGCLPDKKAQYVSDIQQDSPTNLVLMVGDGINDSPVFAASDVSVAMGDGADVTKYAADIIILKGNLNSIISLINAAKQTRTTIKSNLYWSLIYNLVILPVAMLGYVAPYIAVIGMSASSILVVTNSLRLLKVK